MRRFPLVVGLIVGLAVPAGAQINARFSQSDNNGVCYFGVEGPGPKGGSSKFTLEFTYRVADGNLGIDLKTNSFPKAAMAVKAESDKTVNVTLETNVGKSKPSRSGGYESGFYERLWAGWGGGAPSEPVFALLKQAKTLYVKADGERYGPFDMQMKGLPWNSLNSCAERVRKAAR